MKMHVAFSFPPLTWKLNAASKSHSLGKTTIYTSRVSTLLLSLGISTLLSGLFAPPWVQAADGTWNGSSGATWNTSATNWSGVSGTPWDITNGSGNTAIFSSGANATVSGGSNVYVNNITFNANTTLLYTSPPEAVVTLAGANATINAASGTTSTIKTVLAGTNGLIKTGGGTVTLVPGDGWWANTLSGPITINGGNLVSIWSASLGDGAGAITINSGGILNVDWNTVTRTGLVTVNGGTLRTQGGSPQLINNGAGFVLQNGAAIATSLGGSGGLTVSGARSILYSANTYTGATVIDEGGDLALMFGGSLSTNTALSLSGTLLANNKSHTVGGLTGASTGRLIGATNYTFTVNKASGADSYGGTIESVGTFIKDGAGTLSLTHANNNTSFPGALTVNNGVLELGGAGRFNAGSYGGAISLSSTSSVLQIATSANQTLSGAISGSGSLVKSSTGTNTLSGANSYSGGTTVGGGGLIASHANALGDASGAVTVITNGLLKVNANMTRTGTVTVNGGELGTDNGSTLTNNGGGFVLTGSSAAAAVVLAGSGGLTVSSSDARLWSQATYTGDTVITSGQLNICSGGGISTNSAVSIASGATINLTSFFAPTNINRTIAGLTGAGILYGGGGTVTVNKASGSDTFSGAIQGVQGFIKEGAGILVLSGSNNYSGGTVISGGTLDLDGGSVSGGITNNANLVIRSDLVNAVSGTGSLTKEGSAIAVLWNPNSYTGATVVNGGQLMLGGAGAISESSTLQIASGASILLTGYLAPADTNRTFAGLTGAGILYGHGGTVTINKDSGSDTFSGDIQGGQGLIKSGAGTLVLSGPNSYTGGTTVNGGELVISKSNFTATFTPMNISIALSNTPSGGNTFAILPGSLSGTYGNPNVSGLGQGQTASFNFSTGILSITQGSTGPTFGDAYPGINMTNVAPNGLTYLVNYAFGGGSTNQAKLPMQDTSDPSKLTLVAYVRTNNASGTLNVVGEKGAALDSWDTNKPIQGVAAQDQSGAPSGTQKRIFSTTNSGDRLFLRLKTTLQP